MIPIIRPRLASVVYEVGTRADDALLVHRVVHNRGTMVIHCTLGHTRVQVGDIERRQGHGARDNDLALLWEGGDVVVEVVLRVGALI